MDNHQTEVLIVGAGPASLALAIELGSRAIPCIVVERNAPEARDQRVQIANGHTRKLLHRWGIADISPEPMLPPDLLLAADSLARVENACDRSACCDLHDAQPARWVARRVLEHALREHARTLPHVRFRFGCELRGFEQDQHGVRSIIHDCGSGTDCGIASAYLAGAGAVVAAGIGARIERPAGDAAPAGLCLESYSDRRVFVCGGGTRMPLPFDGHTMNLGLADGVNLGWKLAAVLHGWGGASLLDSYQAERGAVHRRIVDGAPACLAALDAPCPGGMEEGAAPQRRLRGSPRGGQQARTPPHAIAAAPAWMLDGGALYEGFGPGFTLLATGGWTTADLQLAQHDATTLGVPLSVLRPAVPGLAALYGARLVLIRSDLCVAWRGDAWPYEGRALLELVTGHRTCTEHASCRKCYR
ncbi:MAG: FAD-dependent monooxygenase [Pseudomonadota bacterium]